MIYKKHKKKREIFPFSFLRWTLKKFDLKSKIKMNDEKTDVDLSFYCIRDVLLYIEYEDIWNFFECLYLH